MRIHGITDQMVMDKPKIHEIIHEISQRIAGNIVVGYNVRFDIGFIETALRRSDIIPGPWTAIDVLAVARTATEKISLPDKKLSTLKEYFSIGGDSHRSENDCSVTYEVLLKSLEMISKRDQEYKSIQADRCKRLNVKELSYLNELTKAFISADLESPEFEIMSNFVIALSYRGNLFGRVKLRGKDASIQFIGGDSKDTVAIAEDDNISIYTPRFIDTARAYNAKKKTSNNIYL
jgi:DNA polymerase III epsilon subunit family exonuclease